MCLSADWLAFASIDREANAYAFFSPSGAKLGNDGSNGADGLDGGIMGEEAYDMTALEVWAGVGLHEDL